MLIPGWTVTVRSSTSISRILFMSFTSTRIPCLSGTAPSVSPVAPARGTTGTRSRFASLTTSEICSAEVGSTTACGMNSSHLCFGKGEGTRARLKSAERPVKTWSSPQICDELVDQGAVGDRGRHQTSNPADSATSSKRSNDLDVLLLALLGERALRPGAGGDERVDSSSASAFSTRRRLISAVRSGFSIAEVRAGAGAVRPLGDVVDVDERQPRDRPQDLARLLVGCPCACSAGRVVVGRHALDRRRSARACPRGSARRRARRTRTISNRRSPRRSSAGSPR